MGLQKIVCGWPGCLANTYELFGPSACTSMGFWTPVTCHVYQPIMQQLPLGSSSLFRAQLGKDYSQPFVAKISVQMQHCCSLECTSIREDRRWRAKNNTYRIVTAGTRRWHEGYCSSWFDEVPTQGRQNVDERHQRRWCQSNTGLGNKSISQHWLSMLPAESNVQ